MHKLMALTAVAGADVARTVWVLGALGGGHTLTAPALFVGLLLATGGLSLAMIGLAMRATLAASR